MTYYNAEHALTVRYPASWKTEEAEQDGVWYRYFLAPPSGPGRKPAVSVTLIAAPLGGRLEDYAQTYLAGNTISSSKEEARQGARGRSWLFASPDGQTRHWLLLLQEEGRVYGLFSQGEAGPFEAQLPTLRDMTASLTLERWAEYPEERNDRFAYLVRIPPSWRESRSFSGGATLLKQYTSPPFGADREGNTAHASLTLTVEPAPGDGGIESYYKASREKLGEGFPLFSHTAWRGGYVDVTMSETPVAVSRGKRFYRAAGGRGYSLSFEARDDIYPRVNKWCDMIAATLKVGPEMSQP